MLNTPTSVLRPLAEPTTLTQPAAVDGFSTVALVHNYLLVLRGAERTFEALANLWPGAPIYTLLYDRHGTEDRFGSHPIVTSFAQHPRARQDNFRRLLPVLRPATRRLSLAGHDLILSSSSAFAHGVRKPAGSCHICYCHSPFRYAWHGRARALREVPSLVRPALALLLWRHRAFDRRAALDVDLFVANAELTRRRIRQFWGRDSVVVHPPVEMERFSIGVPDDYVLFVGELVSHKQPQLAIDAALDAGRRIKVVGSGPERPRLEAAYRGRAEFLGRVGDAELARLYASAAALVIPSVEEFGIAAVEAQAAGRPVVAIDAGGVRETVHRSRTGILVPPPFRDGLARALRSNLTRFDPEEIRQNATRFSRPAFERQMREIIEQQAQRGGGIAGRGL